MKHPLFALPLLALFGCGSAQTEDATATASDSPSAASPAPANAEEDIRHFLQQEYPDAESIQYALGWHDLDGDGANEAIVYVVNPMVCGTGGCPTLVLTPAGPMWRKVGDISVSRTPVSVLKSATNGWQDLTVDISGGGQAGGIALLRFDGQAYPSNPTVPPAQSAEGHGEILIAEDPAFVTLNAEAKSGD